MPRYSRSVKERAKKLVAQYGDLRLVAKVPGMPKVETLQKWADEEGWTVFIDGTLTIRTGRPKRFETAVQLEAEIGAYFLSLMEDMMHMVLVKDEDGNEMAILEPMDTPDGKRARRMVKAPTIPGLCINLDISKQTLDRYRLAEHDNQEEMFSEVIERALLMIEEFNMQKIYDPDGREGAKFILERVFKYYPKTIIEQVAGEKRLEDYFLE